jgi:hypothetical protein
MQAMEHKPRAEAGHAIYKMRKAIMEPVFGQIKARRGFRHFSFRSVGSVRLEWQLICLTGNILKLFRSKAVSLRMDTANGLKVTQRATSRPCIDQFAAVVTSEGAARQKDRVLGLESRFARDEVAIQRTFARIGPAGGELISDRLLADLFELFLRRGTHRA